jgi:hypothetical protein
MDTRLKDLPLFDDGLYAEALRRIKERGEKAEESVIFSRFLKSRPA